MRNEKKLLQEWSDGMEGVESVSLIGKGVFR